jgi:upstream activation factor subunit UAF30
MATKPAKPATKASEAKPAKAAKTTAAKDGASKAAAAQTAEAPAPKKVNAALAKPLKPSHDLGAVVGTHPLARTEVVSKVWAYIRKHNLQNPENKREILADAKLKAVFGKDRATMFEMNKLLSAHLS